MKKLIALFSASLVLGSSVAVLACYDADADHFHPGNTCVSPAAPNYTYCTDDSYTDGNGCSSNTSGQWVQCIDTYPTPNISTYAPNHPSNLFTGRGGYCAGSGDCHPAGSSTNSAVHSANPSGTSGCGG